MTPSPGCSAPTLPLPSPHLPRGSLQVLLYDPLFDWTMNPLKALYLQRDEQQELNATLGSTMAAGNMDNQRKFRCGD